MLSWIRDKLIPTPSLWWEEHGLPTLWYENKDGVRWIPRMDGYPSEPPDGFIYHWSKSPLQVEERCFRPVIQDEVDKCDHDPEFIKRTGGWMEGLKGRECMQCNGTQVVNVEDYPDGEWPDEWKASGSRPVMSGSTGYPSDIVLAMLRPSAVEIARQVLRYGSPASKAPRYSSAVLLATTACEACLNVLCHRYGLVDGYRKGSKEWRKAGTACDLCEPDRVQLYEPPEGTGDA